MKRARFRLLILLAGLGAFLFIVMLLYHAGMARLEGKPRWLLESLEWMGATFTTTGYGRDTTWSHPAMVALVLVVQFAGMVMVPMVIALFVLPYLAERFEQRLPRAADPRLDNHVIVYRFGPAVETLLQRLRSKSIATLVAESDESQARIVMDRGENVVFSRSDERSDRSEEHTSELQSPDHLVCRLLL